MEVAALTAFLAPFLPALMRAGESAAEAVAKRVGDEALEHARALWGRLRPKVEEKPAAAEAARKVADTPEDPRWQIALELQIEELLAEDTGLAREIASLWQQADAAGVVAAGERSVAVRGDVSGTIITGDSAHVDR